MRRIDIVRLDRKNKGFSIIEIMVVIGIMGILIAIISANSGKQREKAAVEQMAGEVRDYLVRAGATASKIQQDLAVGIDGNRLLARVGGNDVNFEGGGNSLDLSHFQGTISLMSYNNNLFGNPNADDGHLSLSVIPANMGEGRALIIRPKGLSDDGNGSHVCIRVLYGSYAIMIDVVGTGNINMYVTANAQAEPNADESYFSYK